MNKKKAKPGRKSEKIEQITETKLEEVLYSLGRKLINVQPNKPRPVLVRKKS